MREELCDAGGCMPELPDLIHIRTYLAGAIPGQTVTDVLVKQPIVLRNGFDRPIGEVLTGSRISAVSFTGPFLVFDFGGAAELDINLMLAGRIQHQRQGEKPPGYLCLSLGLSDGSRLTLSDEQKMAKAYLVPPNDHALVPGFESLGADIQSPSFTPERFRAIARQHGRKQVRVMINDHRVLSSIGNAYADEILFEAGIHPKTLVAKIPPPEIDRLYEAIRSVMAWGAEEVCKANQPIQVKVREHMRVRNRHGLPCPRCGTTIRREGVRGHDVFFCPRCQPPTRKHFIDWNTLEGAAPQPGGAP
jgi:formamidopyrimidine-DNA glycosylase